jgi:formylglycine-generating enzyme required for sulfatase activity/tRNA A-37 threonylcarbamoyl transferase component Bud32
MVWQPGTLLDNGKYQIEEELSRRGGFGITYKAIHLKLKTPVVIKSPHEYRSQEPNYGDFVSCFEKEGRTLARLAEQQQQHPNIVRVQNFFDEGATPCMVMDYVPGETLDDRVKREGAIPEETVVPWIITIAHALDRVHELGLVHRDANPANIIINLENQPILIDFGIALNIQPRASTTIAAFSGHMTFAPLEQLMPDYDDLEAQCHRDPRIDIYCLAATLYFAITGQDPKGACARDNSISRKGKDSLIPPKAIDSTISDRINHAILSAMEMDPDDRPPTMKAWIRFLTSDDELLSAITPPTVESLPIERWDFQTIEVNEKAEVIAKPDRTVQIFEEKIAEDLSIKMIIIPGGSFMMGSPEDELDSYSDEKPQHLVTVPSFAIGQFVVTQAQWKAIAQLPKVKLKLELNPSYLKTDDRPVNTINWYEAVEFCDRLMKLSRKPYRLPSEAEWEYACRAGTTSPFNFGPTISTNIANYRGTDLVRDNGTWTGNYGEGPKGENREQTLSVGQFSPNNWGLYDTHGNVWEWCADDWHGNYDGAPIDGGVWNASNDSGSKVTRGGSYNNTPTCCRSAIRFTFSSDNRLSSVGFRLLLPLAPRILV